MTEINCPFYGRHLYQATPAITDRPFLLLNTNGNQCALITSSFAPCVMEVRGVSPAGHELAPEDVDWRECPRVKDLRVG